LYIDNICEEEQNEKSLKISPKKKKKQKKNHSLQDDWREKQLSISNALWHRYMFVSRYRLTHTHTNTQRDRQQKQPKVGVR
jgi:hypothetical protein